MWDPAWEGSGKEMLQRGREEETDSRKGNVGHQPWREDKEEREKLDDAVTRVGTSGSHFHMTKQTWEWAWERVGEYLPGPLQFPGVQAFWEVGWGSFPCFISQVAVLQLLGLILPFNI